MSFYERFIQPLVNSQHSDENSESDKKAPLTQAHTNKRQPSQREQRLTRATLIGASAFGVASALVIVVNGILPNIFSPTSQSASVPALGYTFPDTGASRRSRSSSKNNHCDGKGATASLDCLLKPEARIANQCQIGGNELSAADMEVARIAWKYFENNYNESTGLVNSVHAYPSTTMWDTGSAIAAFIAAKDFGFITQKEFDDATSKLISSLRRMELFEGKAPNKVYHTHSLEMVDYGNNPVEGGIGVSVLDLARLISWMNTLQCMHPKYAHSSNKALSRWDYTDLIHNEEMYGMARDPLSGEVLILQEGRLGYEQYAGKIFDRVGFSVETAKDYENKHRADTNILGTDIAYDSRDPRIYHANNYVVTESYAMDAMELGVDKINRELMQNIFDVQKKRWQETGIVTAISEDNINQDPWFLYNTIFNAGIAFNTITETGVQHDHLKAVSTKAAISMALLYPEDEYSQVLLSTVESAYDEDLGWYSGVYENGGYNDVTTANTNGVILSGLLHKKYGTIFEHCDKCAGRLNIESDVKKAPVEDSNATAALTCESCELDD